jgi:hypothetical protein
VEKAFMDESDIVCWYYDHSKGRSLKGINILTAFYTSGNEYGTLQVPIDYQIVSKTKRELDEKTGKERWVSEKSKNEVMRDMIRQTIRNQVQFGYILADSWFSSVENMRFIQQKGKKYIFEINDNRPAAVNEEERKKGHFIRIDRMGIPDGEPVLVYLKELGFPVVLYKQVFKNKDGTAGIRYLVTNDEAMKGDRFETLYKRRWSVEVYHESIKQNTSIGSSPAHRVRTQSNHICVDIWLCEA